MIVVTTPTGNIGRHVVAGLLNAGELVRVIVRDPAKLEEHVRGGVDVVAGSHGDAATLDRAFQGAHAVFWLAPPDPRLAIEQAYPEFTRPAVEALRRHRIGHVVAVTALGRNTQWADRAGLVSASLSMVDLLLTAGCALRGLAMPGFMDNILQQSETIKAQGLIFGVLDPDKAVPATATEDIGVVAARLLRDRSWSGQKDVPVLGPEDLSMNSMAATISDVLGREVRYVQVPFEAFKTRLKEDGMSKSFAQGFIDMMRAKNEGMDNVAQRDPEVAAPTSFRAWCEAVLKPALAN